MYIFPMESRSSIQPSLLCDMRHGHDHLCFASLTVISQGNCPWGLALQLFPLPYIFYMQSLTCFKVNCLYSWYTSIFFLPQSIPLTGWDFPSSLPSDVLCIKTQWVWVNFSGHPGKTPQEHWGLGTSPLYKAWMKWLAGSVGNSQSGQM